MEERQVIKEAEREPDAKSGECTNGDSGISKMEVSKKDRSIALARSAEVRDLNAEYFEAQDIIPTGLKLGDQYRENRERILKVLGATEDDWNDYRWHLKNHISDVNVLSKIIKVSRKEKENIIKTGNQYRWRISPYYASLMDPEDRHCPVTFTGGTGYRGVPRRVRSKRSYDHQVQQPGPSYFQAVPGPAYH